MDTTRQIEKFLHDIRRRNRREIILDIPAIPFVIGMMWFVFSPRGDLSGHPASNVDHWATEMLRQAKLLRRVHLWVLGAFVPGIALVLWSSDEVDLKFVLSYSITIACIVLGFAVATWLNRWAASKLTLEASSLKEAQGMQPTS